MVEHIRVACISESLKKLLTKRFKSGARIIPELEGLLDEIEPLPPCTGKEDLSKLKKRKRKRQPRMVFMSVCMKPQSKGGMGKDMTACSMQWKQMPDSEKNKYKTEDKTKV